MEKTEFLKNLANTIRGLDKQELETLAEAVSGEVAARRPGVELESIAPGMSADERKSAQDEINRLLEGM